jgi:hypothetical protein
MQAEKSRAVKQTTAINHIDILNKQQSAIQTTKIFDKTSRFTYEKK